jgi:hypothetical protein
MARAIAHRLVSDERRGEVDGEAGAGPLFEKRRRGREHQRHAEELGPRKLRPEVGGEAELGELLRHHRQAQLRVSGEANLQAEERGDYPIDDGLDGDEGRFRRVYSSYILSTPNCFAYSALNRCQPLNFMASAPVMGPIGLPARSRSRTSKQMCQPAAPHEM